MIEYKHHSSQTISSVRTIVHALQGDPEKINVIRELAYVIRRHRNNNSLSNWIDFFETHMSVPNLKKIDLIKFIDHMINTKTDDASGISRYLSKIRISSRNDEAPIDLDLVKRVHSYDSSILNEITRGVSNEEKLKDYSKDFPSILDLDRVKIERKKFDRLRLFIAKSKENRLEEVVKYLDQIISSVDNDKAVNTSVLYIAIEYILHQKEKISDASVQKLIKFNSDVINELPTASFATFTAVIRSHAENGSKTDLFKKLNEVKEQLKIIYSRELKEEKIIGEQNVAEARERLFRISPYFYYALGTKNISDPIYNLTILVREDCRLLEVLSNSEPKHGVRGLSSEFAISYIKALGKNYNPSYSSSHFIGLVDFIESQTNPHNIDNECLSRRMYSSILYHVFKNNKENHPLENFVTKLPILYEKLKELRKGQVFIFSEDICDTNDFVNDGKHMSPELLLIGLCASLKSKMIYSIDKLILLFDELIEKKNEFANHPIFCSKLLPYVGLVKRDVRDIIHPDRDRVFTGILGNILGFSVDINRDLEQFTSLISNPDIWNRNPNQLFDYLEYRVRHLNSGKGDIPFSVFKGKGPVSSSRFLSYQSLGKLFKVMELAGSMFAWIKRKI